MWHRAYIWYTTDTLWVTDADGIADIHLQNILLGLRDHTVLRVIEDTESSSPDAVKTYDDCKSTQQLTFAPMRPEEFPAHQSLQILGRELSDLDLTVIASSHQYFVRPT